MGYRGVALKGRLLIDDFAIRCSRCSEIECVFAGQFLVGSIEQEAVIVDDDDVVDEKFHVVHLMR